MTTPQPPIYQLAALRKLRGAGRGFCLDVSTLTVRRGEKVALVGNSGCGKSTLLDMLALALQPDDGQILFQVDRGIDIGHAWRNRDLARLAALRLRHLGYVLQTGGLLPFLDVRGNILVNRRLLGLPADDTAERLTEALGIRRHLGKRPAQLSVGERQRVAIARALAHSPSVVIADEPTASLDPVMAEEVMSLLSLLAANESATLIIATHDWALAQRFGFRRLPFEVSHGADGTVRAMLREVA